MQHQYYKPYSSDDEDNENNEDSSDSDSEDSSDNGSGSDSEDSGSGSGGEETSSGSESENSELPQNNFQKFISESLTKSENLNTASMSLNTETQRRKYEKRSLGYSYVNYAKTGDESDAEDKDEDEGFEESNGAQMPKPEFSTSKNTSLIMINSNNRDTTVFNQPTNFYIRLPRTYKNITNIAITQLKLLSSFYYFSPIKNNTSLSILELGRLREENNKDVSNIISCSIRQGTYDALSLVSELNIQLNKTPLFADISGGKGAFFARFQVGGDLTELFNEPGDNTFNSLNGTYSTGLSKADIISRYFFQLVSQGTQLYTANQALVAYYYPVLKEMMLDEAERDKVILNTPSMLGNSNIEDSLASTKEQPFDRIVYGFRGLSDVYVTNVIGNTENQSFMDDYRKRNTFSFFLANKYTCTYDTTIGRFKIIAPSINTSINADLINVFSNLLVKEITSQNRTTSQYATLQTSVLNKTAAISDFYNFIHRNITNSFGIDFGKYTRSFLADSNNELTIFDASGFLGFSSELSVNIVGKQIETSQILSSDISGTWPQITSNRRTITGFSDSLPTDEAHFLDISNSSEFRVGFVDTPFSVNPKDYAQFRFKSRCRQNMSFITLPRTPQQKEIQDASEAFVLTSDFFDTQGNCILDPQNVSDFYLYDISQSMFETQDSMIENTTFLKYMRQQKPFINPVQIQDLIVPDYRNHIYFQMNTDSYKQDVDVSNYQFDVQFNIDCQTGLFPCNVDVFMYRDRAAFMLDVASSKSNNSFVGRRKNYFNVFKALAGENRLSIDIRVLGNSAYYFLLVARGTNFGTFLVRPYCFLSKSYGVKYPVTSDLLFRRMPYEDVKSIAMNPSAENYKSALTPYEFSSNYLKGYDSREVSNDYLDYLIRTNDGSGFDPVNFGNFSFRKFSPSASNTKSDLWFYPNSQNTVIDLATNQSYINSSNISSFKLGPDKVTTFKIINPFVANDASNQEMFIVPTEQTLPNLPDSEMENTFNGSFGFNDDHPENSFNIINRKSKLYICDNPFNAIIDVSYNPLPPSLPSSGTNLSFGPNRNGVTGFTFQIPFDRSADIQQIVIKFVYINPTYQPTGNNKDRTILQDPILTNGECLDIQPSNRKARFIRIFKTTDIVNKNYHQVKTLVPIVILQRVKVYQIGSFTPALAGQPELPRSRNPEWGTYYTYNVVKTNNNKVLIPFLPESDSLLNKIAPAAKTYVCLPFDEFGNIISWYGLSFTKRPFTYDSTEKNLLVSYQYNYLLTSNKMSNLEDDNILEFVRNNFSVSVISKIAFQDTGIGFDPALDLSRFGNISEEFADTQMFLYDDTKQRLPSIIRNDPRFGSMRESDATKKSSDDMNIWGAEKGTIYKARDDDSGFNFFSYIHNVPIRKNNLNLINIRGYVPTSKFTSGLRIIAKNWTDFGTLTLAELSEDIDVLVGGPVEMRLLNNDTLDPATEYIRYSNGNFFSRKYAGALLRFNNSFKVRGTFGLGLGSANYLGESFDGVLQKNAFRSALAIYIDLYNGIKNDQIIVSTASTNSNRNLQRYVNNRYFGVLPATFLKRARLSDPIPFQIQFKSVLVAPFNQAFDEWGLGWNLGFAKEDTTFGTQQIAETFIRIVDDYIYLRMNEEIGMNTIDITEKEYLKQSQESFGQNSRYFSKLLLNTFGNFSQTYIQAPKNFNPVLGKLEKLHFQLVDRYGVILDNNDCEFNITLQVTEQVDLMTEGSTLNTGVKKNEPIITIKPKKKRFSQKRSTSEKK